MDSRRRPIRGGHFEETRQGEFSMSLATHIDELYRKHGDIERQIDEAMAHPSTDTLEIGKLKRRKLAIKDEIVKLESPVKH